MRLLPGVRPLGGAALRRRRRQQGARPLRREPRVRQARRRPGGEMPLQPFELGDEVPKVDLIFAGRVDLQVPGAEDGVQQRQDHLPNHMVNWDEMEGIRAVLQSSHLQRPE